MDGAEGAVAIFRGGPGGLTATAARLWSHDSPGIPGLAGAHHWFGDGLASADYGRSGHDDLVIGAGAEDVQGFASAGAVTVLYGSATSLTASGSQRWTQASSGIRDAPEKSDAFGAALAGSPSILSRR